MSSFVSSIASWSWSPSWLLQRLLNPQTFVKSNQSCSPAAPNIIMPKESVCNSNICDHAAVSSASTLPQQEMAALGRIFEHFDENKDGKVSHDELRRSLHMFGIEADDAELLAMINGADWNKDGFLDFSEFASFYHCMNEGLVRQVDPGNKSCDSHETSQHSKEEDEVGTDLRDAFKLFDKNGDGYICAEELQSVLSSMGIPQGKLLTDCRDMIRSVDVDGDGQVNFDEFKKMMVSGIGGK